MYAWFDAQLGFMHTCMFKTLLGISQAGPLHNIKCKAWSLCSTAGSGLQLVDSGKSGNFKETNLSSFGARRSPICTPCKCDDISAL